MAANTDKFLKAARAWVGQIGAGGVADASTATIPLASTTNLPTDTAVVAVIDRVDADGDETPSLEEVIVGVVSGSNLVTSTRGVEGTAQAHIAGAVVEVLWTATNINTLIDGLLTQHDQAGRHTNVTASNITASGTSTLTTLVSTGNQTLSHVSASDITARMITPNLGSDAQGDVYYRSSAGTLARLGPGTTGQFLKTQGAAASPIWADVSASSDGWIASSDTWVYASASTFTIAGVDRTAVYTKGTRLKLTQTTAKYAVVVGSSFSTDTTVTIAVNNDYTIANAAITSPFYSYASSPAGYPTWFGYDPTYTGFSAVPTIDVLYKIDGRSITLYFGEVTGTSNSATFELTLPVAPACTNVGGFDAQAMVGFDNGSWLNDLVVIGLNDGNITAKVGKTISSKAANAYAGFTTSGGKGLAGTITYRF